MPRARRSRDRQRRTATERRSRSITKQRSRPTTRLRSRSANSPRSRPIGGRQDRSSVRRRSRSTVRRRSRSIRSRRARSRSRRTPRLKTPRLERRSRSSTRLDKNSRDRRCRRHSKSRANSKTGTHIAVHSRNKSQTVSNNADVQNSTLCNSLNINNKDSDAMHNDSITNDQMKNDENYRSEINTPQHCNNITELGSTLKEYEESVNKSLVKGFNQVLEAVSTVNPHNKEKFASINVVPEFDPKIKNQTIITWLNKVNECAEIYGWNCKQTAHYALPKLMGTAKRWYEGQPSVMHTWEVWQEKLKSAFPVYENYGRLLTEMLNIRARFGDDLEDYYYEKLIALNRCRVNGRDAIDCIVFGIDDRSVRYGAEAVGFEDVDKLLGYLRNVKHEKIEKNRKFVRSSTEFNRKIVKVDSNSRQIKCFNCHEIGHTFNNCKKPITKCQKCLRLGHNDPNCTREVWKDKSEVKSL